MNKRRTGAVLASRTTLIAGTRAHKKRSRLQVGPLSSLLVAKTTERRYDIAYGRFCFFTIAEGWLPLSTLLLLNQCCAAYVEACWEEGEPVNWAGDALGTLLLLDSSTCPCAGGTSASGGRCYQLGQGTSCLDVRALSRRKCLQALLAHFSKWALTVSEPCASLPSG